MKAKAKKFIYNRKQKQQTKNRLLAVAGKNNTLFKKKVEMI